MARSTKDRGRYDTAWLKSSQIVLFSISSISRFLCVRFPSIICASYLNVSSAPRERVLFLGALCVCFPVMELSLSLPDRFF